MCKKITQLTCVSLLTATILSLCNTTALPQDLLSLQTLRLLEFANQGPYQNYSWIFPGSKKKDFDHRIHIVLNSDSTFSHYGRINTEEVPHSITIGYRKKDKKKIVPGDTKYIYISSRMVGFAMDSCWLFFSNDSRINTFSYIPESDYMYAVYIQKDNDGPLYKLTKENLVPMVQDNKEALELAEQGKLPEALELYNEGISFLNKYKQENTEN